MDWVVAGADGIHPSVTPDQRATGAKDAVPIGSYDAIRVYLWLGIADPLTPGLQPMLTALPGMASGLRRNPVPPLVVDNAGKVLNPDGTAGFSAAVLPFLEALHLNAQANIQRDRLVATRDASSGLYGRGAAYYDQNLALFATGWAEQQYRFERDGKLKVKWK